MTIDDYVNMFAIGYLLDIQKQLGNEFSKRINTKVSEGNILRVNETDVLLTRQDQNVLSILHKLIQKETVAVENTKTSVIRRC